MLKFTDNCRSVCSCVEDVSTNSSSLWSFVEGLTGWSIVLQTWDDNSSVLCPNALVDVACCDGGRGRGILDLGAICCQESKHC